MGDITQALRTAQSGLLVNQQTLNIVANNIANLNTEGYSRKIVKTESRVIAGIGAGVQIYMIGAEAGVDLYEIADFFAGFALVDFARDDF